MCVVSHGYDGFGGGRHGELLMVSMQDKGRGVDHMLRDAKALPKCEVIL